MFVAYGTQWRVAIVQHEQWPFKTIRKCKLFGSKYVFSLYPQYADYKIQWCRRNSDEGMWRMPLGAISSNFIHGWWEMVADRTMMCSCYLCLYFTMKQPFLGMILFFPHREKTRKDDLKKILTCISPCH